MKIFKNQKNNSGFTLIELLVCLTILAIVLVIGMGLLLATNAGVGASRAQRRSMDNLNFAIESMSRSITYGNNFSCISAGTPASCTGNTLSFSGYNLSIAAPNILYELKTDMSTGFGYISKTVGTGSSVLTDSKRVNITELTFYVLHGEDFSIDPEQPRVTVAIRGVSYASGTPQEFFIQTTLSQRDLKL